MDVLVESLGEFGPFILNVAKAILFLVVGYLAAQMFKRIVRRQIERNSRLDPTISNFVASILYWLIIAAVLIVVLQLFGFQATSLVAILGASTLAIGLALQGTLSDVASGVLLIAFRPYKIGQFVDIDGTSGTVREVTLFTTELVTPDNVQIIMPNSKAWGAVITNFSAHDTRRVDLVFGIDYSDSSDDAMAVIQKIIDGDERVLKSPESWMRVTNLGDSSVDITVRIWVAAEDYWDVKFDTTKAVKEAFDESGISIPYPHQVEISRKA
ncbi:MAG: mechanosensitive ion channel [Rhizobiaceae bacterium]|nr:mechanosensitive ion channel [Rhizobiaceae bacterium]